MVEPAEEIDEHTQGAGRLHSSKGMLVMLEFMNEGGLAAFSTEMLDFSKGFVVCYELLKQQTHMLSNDAVELFQTFPCDLLVVSDNPVQVVAANSNATEDELKEEF